MEWNSKHPSWDFAELEQHAEPNMVSLVSSSSGLGNQSSRMDCLVDLKLGGLGDFRPPEKWKSRPPMSTTVASSGPSKRARAPGNAGQIPSCSVDGCESDLSNSREYHRRHKVCEVHSKTPIVMVGGQEQRFCQQCSRFHLLVEFDEVKRSCRKRLDGHNRRRRKPQPESANRGSLLYPNHQGSRFSVYPDALPTPIQELNWAGIIQTEDTLYTNHLPLHVIDNRQSFSGSFCSYKKERKFPFLQDDIIAFGITTTGQSTCQALLKNISSAESSSKILSNGIPQAHPVCALSLLSSSTQNPGIAMGQMVPACRIPMHQSLISSLPYDNLGRYSSSPDSNYVSPAGFSCSGVEDEQVGTVFDRNADTDLHCQSVFHVGEGSSDGVAQSHPFSWQ